MNASSSLPQIGGSIPIPITPDADYPIFSPADRPQSKFAEEEVEMDLFYPDDW
jgi:hypothetical protein